MYGNILSFVTKRGKEVIKACKHISSPNSTTQHSLPGFFMTNSYENISFNMKYHPYKQYKPVYLLDAMCRRKAFKMNITAERKLLALLKEEVLLQVLQ
jgi:hypothetical protein